MRMLVAAMLALGPAIQTSSPHLTPPAWGTTGASGPVIGFPAITVPAGFTTDGLPVGLEFMARAFAEPTLFRLACAYEQGTHHRRSPALMPALPGEASTR